VCLGWHPAKRLGKGTAGEIIARLMQVRIDERRETRSSLHANRRWRFSGLRARDHPGDFVAIGGMFYLVIAGVAYLDDATARAARAEAAVAQTQLAALRAPLQPHFMFNALHTVVQLIPLDPGRAVEAAECVATLLRTALDEERDVVPLADEWAFVSRYLELEGIRFGERLRVSANVDPEFLDVRVPTFALQTLVENAVQHGAAPRVAPTDIVVTAAGTASELALSVRNTTAPGRPSPWSACASSATPGRTGPPSTGSAASPRHPTKPLSAWFSITPRAPPATAAPSSPSRPSSFSLR
jgi:hypothetical protein